MGTGSVSVVVPVFGVAAYLPQFLDSLDAQELAGAPVDLVFVDDGSPDDSASIISDWIGRRPELAARLVTKDNGGLSSARNAGLDVATGEWVTFPDPDDVLDAGYLGVLTRFVASPEADAVHVVAGRPIIWDDPGPSPAGSDATGSYRDAHPMRQRFDEGTRVVDLVREPRYFHVAANTGLFRRNVLDAYGLRFDGNVRPVWEDGHLTARYLSKFERPRVAMMADARYYYRRRADQSSLMDGQWSDPDKFVTVPAKGWLDALRIAAAEHGGRAPEWLQNMIIYDIRGYFKNDRRAADLVPAMPRQVSDEFFRILHECFRHLDLDVLDRFRGLYVSHEVREVLRMSFAGADPRPAEIAVDRLDEGRGLVRLRYYYAGDAPAERWRAGGQLVSPVFAKTRPCRFYGRDLAFERIVWLPAAATLSVTLDGQAVPLRIGPPELRRLDLRPARIREALAGPPGAPAPVRPGVRPRLGRARRDLRDRVDRVRDDVEQGRATARATLRLSRTTHYRRKYLDAWLLADGDDRAGGNAEHLYRWLRANRPQVNAWFVLPQTAADRARLSGEGFRLIEPGTREHDLALLGALHVVSSQLDTAAAVLSPTVSAELSDADAVRPPHRTYLPPDVTTDDRSSTWNRAAVELFTTASPDELRSIVDDASPYVLSEHEVRLTGLARHDRLTELARTGSEPVLVLLMPAADHPSGAWQALRNSDEVRRAAATQGYRIEYVPDPQAVDDVQQLLADGVVLVTDDDPLSYDMAYLERPVVYLRTDEDAGGDHPRFGPVTTDAAAAVSAVVDILERRGAVEAPYREAMSEAFAFRDGENCRRVHDAIAALTVALPEAELYRTLEPREVLDGRPVADELRGSTG